MNSYINIIKAYLAEHEPDYGAWDIHSLEELLFWHYTELNPINNDTIKADFRELGECFRQLPYKEADKVSSAVNNLCFAHEQAAFCEGFRVGLRLMMELFEEKP